MTFARPVLWTWLFEDRHGNDVTMGVHHLTKSIFGQLAYLPVAAERAGEWSAEGIAAITYDVDPETGNLVASLVQFCTALVKGPGPDLQYIATIEGPALDADEFIVNIGPIQGRRGLKGEWLAAGTDTIMF